MIFWRSTEPFAKSSIETNELLASYVKVDTNKVPNDSDHEYYACPITNFGYDGLHVFIWGACHTILSWQIDPCHPELMGCNWMVKKWSHHELDGLLLMLEDLYVQITNTAEDYLDVSLTDLILPVHEEELLEKLIRPITPDAQFLRPEFYHFKFQFEAVKIRCIYQFVELCKQFNSDIEWSSFYHGDSD